MLNSLYTEFVNEYENRPVFSFCMIVWDVQLSAGISHQLAATCSLNVLIYDRLGYGKSDPMPTHERASELYMELEADVLQEILTKLKDHQCYFIRTQ